MTAAKTGPLTLRCGCGIEGCVAELVIDRVAPRPTSTLTVVTRNAATTGVVLQHRHVQTIVDYLRADGS